MTPSIDLAKPSSICVHFTKTNTAWHSSKDNKAKTTTYDISNIKNEQEFISAIAEAMRFPQYFGHNWDALYDCLTDMSWDDAKGYTLVLTYSETAWTTNTLIISKFITLWLEANEHWQIQRKAFHLVFIVG